jgi:hypothetical protein
VKNVLVKPKVMLQYIFEQGALEIVALTEVIRHPWDCHKIQQ